MKAIWKRAGTCLAVTLLAGALVTVSGAEGASAAVAGPIQAGLTMTPSTATVGSTVVIVATATNNSSAAASASLGLDNLNYANERFTAVAGSPGCTPRNLHHLIYCGIPNLAPGATASITLTIQPQAVGTYSLRSYARNTYAADDTFAYGTLTVS